MFVIILSGTIATGKSTFAQLLHSKLQIPVYSFGFLIRNEAKTRGLGTSRPVLQNLGLELFESLGPEGFLSRLIGTEIVSCIIEGVRHKSIIDAAYSIFDKVLIVFLYNDLAILEERWRCRDESNNCSTSLSEFLHHDVESGIEEIRLLADYAVALDDSNMESAAKHIIDMINET